MSSKRKLIELWNKRADQYDALAEAIQNREDYSEQHERNVESLLAMAESFRLCANELEKS